MPAALLTLAGISLFGLFVATPDQLSRLRDDVLWALAYLANWRFIVADTAYTRLFIAPSPIQHFWSLAVEEQFYMVYPLIVLVGLKLGAGSRKALGFILIAIASASFAASCWLTLGGASVDRVYYGTDTRAFELALGCVLALLLHGRPIPRGTLRRSLEILGAFALPVMVGLWTFVDLRWRWLYTGGLLGYQLIALLVMVAAIQPEGPVRRLLSGRFLCWVGKISYGIYLFHWPIYLYLSPERTSLDQWPLFGLRLGVTFALAAASYRWLEAPIRTRRALRGRLPYLVTPAAMLAVAAGIVVVTHGATGGGVDLKASAERLAAQGVVGAPSFAHELPPSRGLQKPRIAVFGDSTSVPITVALTDWYRKHGLARPRPGMYQIGCGLARKGVYVFKNQVLRRPEFCGDRAELYSTKVTHSRPDVAVVSFGPWEILNRRLGKMRRWLKPGDPTLDKYLSSEFDSVVSLLSVDGTLVVWLTQPPILIRNDGTSPHAVGPFPEEDPARARRFNELLYEGMERWPDTVRVIDVAAYMHTRPGGELDASYRPDGIHWSHDGAARLVDEWLGHEILRVYRDASR
jgi:peptidoglycan/LPS O-acetylase OafA/YrhL